jgi:small subunit ribosomal protein S9
MEATWEGKVYATGRRKTSSARVWVEPGSGDIVVNKREAEDYFGRPSTAAIVRQPLEKTRLLGKVSVNASVRGGGTNGQAGAIRLGISRALASVSPDYREVLKTAGLLTRDARKVERKKYGLHKARKRHQFSKR